MRNPIAITLVCLLLFSTSALSQPIVWDTFEGGNATMVSKPQPGYVHITPTHKLNDTKNVWFYAGIKNLSETTTIDVTVSKNNYLNNQIVYSYERKNWHILKGQPIENTSTWRFKHSFEHDSVFIATTYPYVYTDVLELTNRLQAGPNLKKSYLCYSPGGRAVPVVKIGNPNAKNMIWIISRQHAFEHPTSYFTEGVINHLYQQRNAPLLNDYCFYIVPLMDVDGVYEGATGKDQKPVDMNRSWAQTPPYWPQVNHVRQQVFETALNHHLTAFFDLHSPFPHNNGSHYYSIVGYQLEQQKNLEKFYDIYNKLCGVTHWQHSTGQAPARGRGWLSGGNGIPPYFADVDFTVTNEQAFHVAGTHTLYTDAQLISFGEQYAQAFLTYLKQK